MHVHCAWSAARIHSTIKYLNICGCLRQGNSTLLLQNDFSIVLANSTELQQKKSQTPSQKSQLLVSVRQHMFFRVYTSCMCHHAIISIPMYSTLITQRKCSQFSCHGLSRCQFTKNTAHSSLGMDNASTHTEPVRTILDVKREVGERVVKKSEYPLQICFFFFLNTNTA